MNEILFTFLKELRNNNNKECFLQHKPRYQKHLLEVKHFSQQVFEKLSETDSLEAFKIYRVYNDVRFKKDKPLYKSHFGIVFSRQKPLLRGGYYLHLEPGNSFVGGGFWGPTPEDIFRIRKEFEADASEIQQIIKNPVFEKIYGSLQGEDAVKIAPKGFDKNSPAIALIRKRQWVALRKLTDAEVFSDDFQQKIVESFLALRPFFDYMSAVLTTDANGEPIY